MGDRPDAADHRVSADRRAGFGRAQPRGAFPEERRDDSGKGQPGPDAREISGPLVAVLPDVAHPACLKYLASLPDWPPLDAALAVRLVAESSLLEPCPVSLRSDA
jgi:hypothetical protein